MTKILGHVRSTAAVVAQFGQVPIDSPAFDGGARRVSGELEKGKVNLFFPAKLRRGVPAPQGTGSGTGCPLVRFEAPRARRGDASAELFGGRSAAPASRERTASWRERERGMRAEDKREWGAGWSAAESRARLATAAVWRPCGLGTVPRRRRLWAGRQGRHGFDSAAAPRRCAPSRDFRARYLEATLPSW